MSSEAPIPSAEGEERGFRGNKPGASGAGPRRLGTRGLAGIAMFCSLAIVVAQATTPPVSADPNLLAFLDRPPVSRTDVVKVLGPPSAVFERDGVLTYRLRANKTGYSLAPRNDGWEGVNYDLVLAFSADGELRQHSLVVIRAPTHP